MNSSNSSPTTIDTCINNNTGNNIALTKLSLIITAMASTSTCKNRQSMINNEKAIIETQYASTRTSIMSHTSTSISTNGNIEKHDLSILRVVLMLMLT